MVLNTLPNVTETADRGIFVGRPSITLVNYSSLKAEEQHLWQAIYCFLIRTYKLTLNVNDHRGLTAVAFFSVLPNHLDQCFTPR